MLYNVIRRVFADRVYSSGDQIELSPEEAAPLLALGYLEGTQSVPPEIENKPLPSPVRIELRRLNQMSEDELKALPGIGATKAAALFNKEFNSLEDAQEAASMGDETWREVIEALAG